MSAGTAPSIRRIRFPAVGFAVVMAMLLALVAFVATRGSGGGSSSDSGLQETRPVAVTAASGAGLAPAVRGATFDGSPVAIVNDGRAKLVMFVAHWCPHCRAEVPVITEWLRSADLPEGVDLYAVSTSVNPNAVNYPPSDWLEREGFPVRTMADDSAGSAAKAFGVDAFPYFVAISADGRIVARDSGELPIMRMEQLLTTARG